MTILNELLEPDKITPVLFAFPPVAIPVDSEGKLVAEEEAVATHYVTYVFDVNGGEFAVLEFSKRIFHAVASYNRRHGRIKNLEVLLGRHPDGRFKMNIGNTRKVVEPFFDEVEAETQKLQLALPEEYKNKKGYQVSDL